MLDPLEYPILDQLLEGCQVVGFDYRYIYLNEAAARHGRTTRESLVGKTMMEAYAGIEETSMFVALKRCMEERSRATLENEFTYPDGSPGWFELKMEPVPQGIFILSIDISKRKRAELALESQVRRLQALREIDMAIIGTTDSALVLGTVLEEVLDGLEVDAADILLLRRSFPSLEFAVGRGFLTRGIEKSRIQLGEGYAGKAALERVTRMIPNLGDLEEPFTRESLIRGEGFACAYFVPLSAKGKVNGVLELYHRSSLNPDPRWVESLDALAGQASIAIDNLRLFRDLERSNHELLLAYDTTIEGWSRALDLRDKETEGHTQRVTEMTLALARKAGFDGEEIAHIRRGALLHDIGKLGVPDSILLKPGKLTEEEWERMRLHPVFAQDLLHPIKYLRPALDIPQSHHERWDGSGYPEGLSGEEIPLAARLFAVVDVWDALSNDRPYRPAWETERVLAYLKDRAGTEFDPKAVELFLEVLEEEGRGAL